MDFSLVSIAVCTCNGERFLKEQLNSLVNQDYPNLEIIIVDDKSTDNTLNILNAFSSQYSNIKVYGNEMNLGYKKNFEKAIQLCKGDYIALSDQDDIWELDKISKLVNHIGDAVLIYHDSLFIDNKGKSLNKKMSNILNMYHGNNYKPFLFFNCVSGHACLFKRDIVEKVIPFPELIMHDQWLAFCATNLGEIKYLHEPLVYYRQHEDSDTNILKRNRKKVSKKKSGREKVERAAMEFKIFSEYKYLKGKEFVNKLYQLYIDRLNSYLSPALMIFLFTNYKHLLYIYKKSAFNRFNFVYKTIWGLKLKN